MLQFIVLGLVPGTNFQISFYFLINLLLGSLAVILLHQDLRWLVRFYAPKVFQFIVYFPRRLIHHPE